ncbi:hypothetical protein ACXC9Q_36200 [Kribbella sp. CWNU-51]
MYPTLTQADIDATAAFALGSDALTWLRSRPRRTGLVILSDGTRHLVLSPEARDEPVVATC